MPPKKSSRRKKVPLAVPSTELIDELDEEFDYHTQLNDGFFSAAKKIIERLMKDKRAYEAQKLKKYIDIIQILSHKYVEEVNVNNALEPHIKVAENRLRLALQLITCSEGIINAMKEALMRAWQQEDAILVREQTQQRELKKAKEELAKYSAREVADAAQEHDFGPLAKYKNIIMRERDHLQGNNLELERRLEQHRAYADNLHFIIQSYEDNAKKQVQVQRVADNELREYDERLFRCSTVLEEFTKQNTALTESVKQKSEEVSRLSSLYTQKSADYDTLRFSCDNLSTENNKFMHKIARLENEISDWRTAVRGCRQKLKKTEEDLKFEHEKYWALLKKDKACVEENRNCTASVFHLNREKKSLEDRIKYLRNENFGLEKEITSEAYKLNEAAQVHVKLRSEIQKLKTANIKLSKEVVDLKQKALIDSNTLYGKRADIDKLTAKLDEAKTQESKFLRERIALKQEIESLLAAHQNIEDHLKTYQDTNVELKEKLRLKDIAIISMKKQAEQMHSEKLVIQRNLETTIEDRNNNRNLLTKLNHQLSQLAFEIRSNGVKINNLRLQAEQLASNKRELHSLIKAKDVVLANVRNDLKLARTRSEQMQNLVHEDELKFVELKVGLEDVRTKRSLLGTLLMKRNDEIALLKAKEVNLQKSLDHGQTQYNERVEDIRLLKVEITNLRTERNCLLKATETNADLKKEMVRLHRMLAEERIQNRTLADEVHNPISIHRWRILKGADPDQFELTQKVADLLRQNLKIENEKLSLARDLEEEKKCTEQLRNIIKKMPDDGVRVKLRRQQRLNHTQADKLKSLKANAAIDTIEIQERDFLIADLKRKLDPGAHGDVC